jgi:hypothetical protein
MKIAWSCLLGGVLLCAGCITLPKTDNVKKEEPPPSSTEDRQAGSTEGRQAGSTEGRQAGPPPVMKPRRPAGNVAPEMVNEVNAAEMARRLQQELEHDDAGEAPPVP